MKAKTFLGLFIEEAAGPTPAAPRSNSTQTLTNTREGRDQHESVQASAALLTATRTATREQPDAAAVTTSSVKTMTKAKEEPEQDRVSRGFDIFPPIP